MPFLESIIVLQKNYFPFNFNNFNKFNAGREVIDNYVCPTLQEVGATEKMLFGLFGARDSKDLINCDKLKGKSARWTVNKEKKNICYCVKSLNAVGGSCGGNFYTNLKWTQFVT